MSPTSPENLLTGKTAIVTGANRGIGRAIALELGRLGAHCILSARDAVLLESVAAEIRGFPGGKADAIALDLSLPESPAALADFALARTGRIDIVVNNAGATKRGDFLTLTDADWADGFALKLFGAVRLTRSAWPQLKATNGSVVNISGSGGRTPGAAFTIGGSVNAAMQSFTKALADQGIADGVQVNVINPGPVRTDRFTKRIQVIADTHGCDLAEAERLLVESEKMTRVGEPEDVAGLVAYVVSSRGRFLHGAMIDIDGGATKTL